MKQLIIAGTGALATTPATLGDMAAGDKIPAGRIAFYDSAGYIMSAATAKDSNKLPYISLFVGATEANEMMESIPIIEIKNCSYVTTKYAAGTKFSASVTIPTPVVNSDYSITLVKKGTVPNERDQWSVTTRAVTGDTPTTIATRLAKEMKAKGLNVGLTATSVAGKITVSSEITGETWKLVPSDYLYGAEVTDLVEGMPAILDADYVKDLYRQCIGNRGIYGTDPAGMILHKDPVISGNYDMFTITFYNSRHDKTTSREDVKQVVHLVVPVDSASIADVEWILATMTRGLVKPLA